MTSETLRAVDAVKFIAAHLRTEDDYAEVRRQYHKRDAVAVLPISDNSKTRTSEYSKRLPPPVAFSHL